MATTLFALMPVMTSEEILALKSFYEVENSATLLNALSKDGTLLNLSKRKFDLQLSLEPGNQRLQILNMLLESGNEIAKMNDYWESVSQE